MQYLRPKKSFPPSGENSGRGGAKRSKEKPKREIHTKMLDRGGDGAYNESMEKHGNAGTKNENTQEGIS